MGVEGVLQWVKRRQCLWSSRTGHIGMSKIVKWYIALSYCKIGPTSDSKTQKLSVHYFSKFRTIRTCLSLQILLQNCQSWCWSFTVTSLPGQRPIFVSQLEVLLGPSHTNQNPAYCSFALGKADIPPITSDRLGHMSRAMLASLPCIYVTFDWYFARRLR